MADAGSSLPRHVRARLHQMAEPRIVPAGEVLIAEGQLDAPLVIVIAGALYVSLPRPDGRTAMVGVLSPGDVAGGDPGEEFGAHPEVRALTRSRALVVPYSEFERLALSDEATGRWALRRLLGELRVSQHHVARVTAPKVGMRLEAVLDELARSHGRATPSGTRVTLPLSQEMLAAMVGASREAVNRSLSQLISQGRVGRAGRTYVLPLTRGPQGP